MENYVSPCICSTRSEGQEAIGYVSSAAMRRLDTEFIKEEVATTADILKFECGHFRSVPVVGQGPPWSDLRTAAPTGSALRARLPLSLERLTTKRRNFANTSGWRALLSGNAQ